MTDDDYIVFIVDDDVRIREALSELLASHGIRRLPSHPLARTSMRKSPSGLPA